MLESNQLHPIPNLHYSPCYREISMWRLGHIIGNWHPQRDRSYHWANEASPHAGIEPAPPWPRPPLITLVISLLKWVWLFPIQMNFIIFRSTILYLRFLWYLLIYKLQYLCYSSNLVFPFQCWMGIHPFTIGGSYVPLSVILSIIWSGSND